MGEVLTEELREAIMQDIEAAPAVDVAEIAEAAPAEAVAEIAAPKQEVEIDEDAINKYLSAKTGKTLEEITRTIGEYDATQKWKTENESLIPRTKEAQEIAKFLNIEGNTHEKYLAWKQLDIEKLSAVDKIAKVYELRDGLPKDQAEALAYEKYAADEFADNESQSYKALQASTTLEARNAEAWLTEHKKSYELPSGAAISLEKVKADWGTEISRIINKEESKMTFSFDNEEFSFEIPESSRALIETKIGKMLLSLAEQGIDVSSGNNEVKDIIRNMAKTEATMMHQKEVINAFMSQYKTNQLAKKANVTGRMTQSKNEQPGNGVITSAMSGDEIAELIVGNSKR